MPENDTAPQDPRGALRSLLRDHGQRWQIQLVSTHWEATSHPSPTAIVVHCADSLGALTADTQSMSCMPSLRASVSPASCSGPARQLDRTRNRWPGTMT